MINRIKQITNQIQKIYECLSQLEIQQNYDIYREKVEELKLYLELEKNYYESLKRELHHSKKVKNKIIEEIDVQFDFDYEGMNPLDNFYYIENYIGKKKKLRERRIYNHLITIFNEVENPQALSTYLLLMKKVFLNDKKDLVFPLAGEEVYIYDRVNEFIQLMEKANTQLYFNYLYLLQAKIEDKEIFYQELIHHKHDLYFISPNLEKIGIEDYFSISSDKIQQLKFSNQNQLEEKMINYQLGSISTDVFLELEQILLRYEDSDFLDTNPKKAFNYYYFCLERLFWQTSTVTIDDELLLEHINQLSLIEDSLNNSVRTNLVKTIKN